MALSHHHLRLHHAAGLNAQSRVFTQMWYFCLPVLITFHLWLLYDFCVTQNWPASQKNNNNVIVRHAQQRLTEVNSYHYTMWIFHILQSSQVVFKKWKQASYPMPNCFNGHSFTLDQGRQTDVKQVCVPTKQQDLTFLINRSQFPGSNWSSSMLLIGCSKKLHPHGSFSVWHHCT